MSTSPIAVPADHVRRLEVVAARGYPNEVCGVLIGRVEAERTRVEHVTEAKNLNTDRARDRFLLDPQDFLRADRWADERGLEVVGFWHSHPDHPPTPSQTDLESAWPGYSYLIASVPAEGTVALRSWRLDGKTFIEERIEL